MGLNNNIRPLNKFFLSKFDVYIAEDKENHF